jgi:hypothetical protein
VKPEFETDLLRLNGETGVLAFALSELRVACLMMTGVVVVVVVVVIYSAQTLTPGGIYGKPAHLVMKKMRASLPRPGIASNLAAEPGC